MSVIPTPTTRLPVGVIIIELHRGLWMVKQQPRRSLRPTLVPRGRGRVKRGREAVGVIRGYLSETPTATGVHYTARLPQLGPTQGPRLGEFGDWDRAVAAVLAATTRKRR